jgi:Tfp pilus assembly protein PilF
MWWMASYIRHLSHGDKPHHAVALNAVGWHHAKLGDYVQGQVFCEQGLAMGRELGDRFGEAITLDSLGYCRLQAGDHVQAVALYQQSVVAYRETEDRYYLARTLSNLGDAHLAAGDPDAACAAWHQALVMQEELGSTGAEQLRSKLEDHHTAAESSTGTAQIVR